jgi:hypothetical protein
VSHPRYSLGLAAALAAILSTWGCAQPRPPPSGHDSIESWERRHPAASKDLGTWVHEHPQAAERFFTWDSRHPGAAESFVDWSLAHRGADIDDFAVHHRSWDEFNSIMEHHRPAANAFMAWCRKHPDASQELMHHPAGLYWAGTHLYHSYWDMKNAGQ